MNSRILKTTWIKTTGKIIYQPGHTSFLRKKRSVDEHHTIVTASKGLSDYYRWWIDREFHLWIQPPMLNVHVSVFNGKESLGPEANRILTQLNNTVVEYEYSVDVQQHWKFWVLPVRSEALKNIREQCGVKRDYHFHITIGRMV